MFLRVLFDSINESSLRFVLFLCRVDGGIPNQHNLAMPNKGGAEDERTIVTECPPRSPATDTIIWTIVVISAGCCTVCAVAAEMESAIMGPALDFLAQKTTNGPWAGASTPTDAVPR